MSNFSHRRGCAAGFTGAIVAALACACVAHAERPDIVWTRAGHSSDVRNIQATPTGDRIVSMSLDGSVKVWDNSTGEMQYSLNRYGPTRVSPDGNQIAVSVASWQGGGVDVRNLADGSLVRTVGNASAWVRPAWSPDGTMVAETTTDRRVRIWNVETGALVRTLSGHSGSIRDVAWSADGSFIVTAAGQQGTDNTARIWSAATGQQIRVLTGHTDYVGWLAISSDGAIIATSSGDRSIKLWQTSTGQVLHTIPTGQWPAFGLALSPDGAHVAYSPLLGELRAHRVSDAGLVFAVPLVYGGYSLNYSYDGQSILLGSGNGKIEIHDAANGELVREIGAQGEHLISVKYSTDGRALAYGREQPARAAFSRVRARDGAVEVEHAIGGYLNQNGPVFSPDLSQVATLTQLNTDTTIWNAETAQVEQSLAGHVSVVYASTFSPDGRYYATAGEYQSGLWDAETGEFQRWFLNVVTSSSHAIDFSRDGTQIAICNRQFPTVFDVATGVVLHEFTTSGFGFSAAALSPNADRLAVASEDQMFVWRLADEHLLWSVASPPASGESLVFTTDGRRLFSAGRLGGVQIRDAATGAVLVTYDEEVGSRVTSLALHPSERTFAYTRDDATIVVARNPFWVVGDTDADGCVDLSDLARLLATFGDTDEPAITDLNDDGVCNLSDLATLLGNFGGGCGG